MNSALSSGGMNGPSTINAPKGGASSPSKARITQSTIVAPSPPPPGVTKM